MGDRLLGWRAAGEVHLEKREVAQAGELEFLKYRPRVFTVQHTHMASPPPENGPFREGDLVHHETVILREDQLHRRLPRAIPQQVDKLARPLKVESLADVVHEDGAGEVGDGGVVQVDDNREGPEHALRHVRLLSDAGELAFLHEQDQGLQRGANGDLYRDIRRRHYANLFDLVPYPVHVVLHGLGKAVWKIIEPLAEKRDNGVDICRVRLRTALHQKGDNGSPHLVTELVVPDARAPFPKRLKEAVLDGVPACDDGSVRLRGLKLLHLVFFLVEDLSRPAHGPSQQRPLSVAELLCDHLSFADIENVMEEAPLVLEGGSVGSGRDFGRLLTARNQLAQTIDDVQHARLARGVLADYQVHWPQPESFKPPLAVSALELSVVDRYEPHRHP